ncbi:Tol-Pal system beta propeller repeat protein TolB [Chitinivorax sp. B]|uniref:Tol-Pal system beta propeller repeat protein TolB n=1 Tax=Chitinivorax sp. B TaxID=2502235 RepID=UPI00201719F0|nr:Tol-Pal system beta propeller repeat protein TolB [Chitinivorax sp. B]
MAALACGLACQYANAALTIEIIGGGAKQIPVAIAPLGKEGVLKESVTAIVQADLARSGMFKLVDAASVNPVPTEPNQLNYGDWQSKGAEAIAIGSVSDNGDGSATIRVRLMDVLRKQQLAGVSHVVKPNQIRLAGHKIADVIYEKLTGDKGVFATRIAYILKQGKRYELQVADADGFNAQTVLASSEPIISPAWSADGAKLAYVSFEQKKPIVYSHVLATGQRRVVSASKGSNSAPAWSPDGSRLAVVLTKDGLSQIYGMNADGSGLTRLTNSSGIDTEPEFSPDGSRIVFTSDRGGSPQIYMMSSSGGDVRRVTFDCDYCVSPRFSPDGKNLTFVKRESGKFQVAVMDLASGVTTIVSDTAADESPSFAPNGKIILYATEVGRRGVLAAASSDGRVKQRLRVQSGDIREPAWSPAFQ